MAQQQRSGKPWSGANPIPNIKQFVESLDKDKKERDQKLDESEKQKLDTVTPHQNETQKNVHRKTVTDPTTQKEVQIEDVGKDFMQSVKEPQVWLFIPALLVSTDWTL